MRVLELNEHTRLPLSLVITIGSALVGGVFWLTTLYSDVGHAQLEIAEVKNNLAVLNSIDTRLANIEGYLKAKSEGKEK